MYSSCYAAQVGIYSALTQCPFVVADTARERARLEGHMGPLLPRHVQRAYQELNRQNKIPHHKHSKKRMFK